MRTTDENTVSLFSRSKRLLARWSGSPQAVLVGSFAGLILLGALLLRLPFAHQEETIGFLDCLFTATSAVCVTGLIVVDTGSDFTFAGQMIILALIQLGGLGVMTFGTAAFALFGKRLSLQSQAAVHDSMFQQDFAASFRSVFWTIVFLSLAVEGVGAVLLWQGLNTALGAPGSLFSAVFHAISAFCNAGFSLYPNSLMDFSSNPVILPTVMALIVIGGLGHDVCRDLLNRFLQSLAFWRTKPYRRRNLNSKVVLAMSGFLLVAGFIGLLLLGLPEKTTGFSNRMAQAAFQSVTARTAGFNTIEIGQLPLASLLFLMGLMFIGGSPGSCAGGVKTTTVAIWLAQIRAGMQDRGEAHLFGRRISRSVVAKASVLLSLGILWNLLGIGVLSITESNHGNFLLQDIAFEQISAFATVGLSTGITAALSSIGKLWIIITMFIGRLGPLTIMLLVVRKKYARVRYPVGKVMIG